jgi:hypothetical protein
MRYRPLVFSVMLTVTCGGFFACGSRTELVDDGEALTNNDDSGTDARKPRDAGLDADLPPIDAKVPFDASRLDCPDADATLIYLITEDNQLLSFYPPSAAFTLIGNIACPAEINPQTGVPYTPFSMAVDRRGTAYVEFDDGSLFKVDTATAACTATTFVTNQHDFESFGMSFSTNGAGPSETLYVAGGSLATNANPNETPNQDLGSIDVTNYQLTDIGPFNPVISDVELTGTGDGRLFAFWSVDQQSNTNISEVDKTTGNVTGSDELPGTSLGNAWAFGFWGGDFYTFTQPNGQSTPSVVTQFDPVTKAVNVIGGYPSPIVGAGVSTCAPQ